MKTLSFLSCQGVNGAVQYPRSFLKEAYQLVRERGGVCISDEVSFLFLYKSSRIWGTSESCLKRIQLKANWKPGNNLNEMLYTSQLNFNMGHLSKHRSLMGFTAYILLRGILILDMSNVSSRLLSFPFGSRTFIQICS